MSVIRSGPDLQLNITNRQILQLALPISLALLVPQINFITNNIFLSQLSAQAFGAAGITGVYYLIFASIGIGLNNGLQALISRRAGENRPEEIGKLFVQGICISLAIAIIGILITLFIAPIIYEQFLKDETTKRTVMDFLRIRIFGLPFLYIYQMRNALLVGTNRSKYLVIGTLAETITNIILDYGLIFGRLGMPRLGFNGAAYASIIAEATGMVVVLLIIQLAELRKDFALRFHAHDAASNTRLILKQSSPLIFQHAISIISWQFFFILIERNAQTPYDLAVSNIMRNIFGFFGLFTWAFAATTNTMVSNIIGQGLEDRVTELIKKIALISFTIAVVIFVLLNLLPVYFLSIFGEGEIYIKHAVPVIRVVSVAILFMSMAAIWLSAVTGTGSTRESFRIEAISILVYSGYIYLVLEVLHKTLIFAWMSEWVYWILLLILSHRYIKGKKWVGRRI
jgi:multidrug resistance protein, MATE family